MLIAAEIRCDQAAQRLLAARPATLTGLAAKAICVRNLLECVDDADLLDIIIADVRGLNEGALPLAPMRASG